VLAALFVTIRPDPGNANRARMALMSTGAACAGWHFMVLTVLAGRLVFQSLEVRTVPASSVLMMSVPVPPTPASPPAAVRRAVRLTQRTAAGDRYD
jgi:hypothetical protein